MRLVHAFLFVKIFQISFPSFQHTLAQLVELLIKNVCSCASSPQCHLLALLDIWAQVLLMFLPWDFSQDFPSGGQRAGCKDAVLALSAALSRLTCWKLAAAVLQTGAV